jgi:hypothetical protein
MRLKELFLGTVSSRASRALPCQRGLLISNLVYNGPALWPTVVLHTLLAGWCVLGLHAGPRLHLQEGSQG